MSTLVIAPHPDDEVLGVGGTLLRRKAEGEKLAWLIVTSISVDSGWSRARVDQRADEIEQITSLFGFDQVFQLNLPTTQLDRVPMSDLVGRISEAVMNCEPDEVFVPHPSDVHTDHRVVFDAVASCTKWFRNPSIRRVLAYETLSETDFGVGAPHGFRPNYFVNIERFIAGKLRGMSIYASEVGQMPFPRSTDAIKALATVRGAAAGYVAAEAFELLRERV